ncbi:hypothetical protein RJT34_24657 [Clitoria ternatea]|uniref:Uncharacterized protein n=1 Tax=Clitoria ternatea TaxID=43366 RepID=A0AAN9FQA4_CLITE
MRQFNAILQTFLSAAAELCLVLYIWFASGNFDGSIHFSDANDFRAHFNVLRYAHFFPSAPLFPNLTFLPLFHFLSHTEPRA